MKIITFAEAINEALDFSLTKDKLMICYGLELQILSQFLEQLKDLSKSLEKIESLICQPLKMQ